MACKQYAGKPPGALNKEQDLSFDYKSPRKWGLIIYQDEVRTGARTSTWVTTPSPSRSPRTRIRSADP